MKKRVSLIEEIQKVQDDYGDNEIEIDHEFFKDLAKERRRRKAKSKAMLRHIQRIDQVDWASKRQMNIGSHLTLDQIANLERWFNIIDVDGSGDISLMELADPLLTTGLANSIEECVEIFNAVDQDGSGEIEFEEFLELVTIKSSGRLARNRKRIKNNNSRMTTVDEDNKAVNEEAEDENAMDPGAAKNTGILSVLENLKSDEHNSLTVTTAIGIERRRFLLKAVMPKLSKYKLRVDQEKFQAIQSILLASHRERRKTLLEASWNLANRFKGGSRFKAFLPESVPKETRKISKPPMPWLDEQKRTKKSREGDMMRYQNCERKGKWPQQSLVLPRLVGCPSSTQKKQYVTKLRGACLASSGDKEKELFLHLKRNLEDEQYPAKMNCETFVHGGSMAVNKKLSEKTLHGKDVSDFRTYLRKRADQRDKILKKCHSEPVFR